MTDLEDLRARLHDAAAIQTAPPDLIERVERRAARAERRRPVLAVAAAVAALGLSAGAALVATSDGGGETAPVTGAKATATEPSPSTTPSPASEWALMASSPLSPRVEHLTLAMGDEVLVWGGRPTDGSGAFLSDGAVYDAATDTWRTIPDAPLAGASVAAVWTGEEAILVSGGQPGTDDRDSGGPAEAAAFDPRDETWRELAGPPADVTPLGPSAVWTGSEVVVLDIPPTGAGVTPIRPTTYDPATDTWTTGTPSVVSAGLGAVVWTGSEAVVVTSGGPGRGVQAYDPTADEWRSFPWGLEGSDRPYPVVAWTGDRLFVGGGNEVAGDTALARQAALLDLATGTWTLTSPAPVPLFGPERGPSLWTGEHVVTLAGSDGTTMPSVGMGMGTPIAYDPATDSWTTGPMRPGDGGLLGAAWAWAAGRAVVPLGGTTTLGTDGAPGCCAGGPAGGATYAP